MWTLVPSLCVECTCRRTNLLWSGLPLALRGLELGPLGNILSGDRHDTLRNAQQRWIQQQHLRRSNTRVQTRRGFFEAFFVAGESASGGRPWWGPLLSILELSLRSNLCLSKDLYFVVA